jgi:pyridoxal phosphate enzyme (YggS family)
VTLAARLAAVHARIAAACAAAGRDPAAVTLVAVSKGQELTAVGEALALGQVAFGENRTAELLEKARALAAAPGPLRPQWHMIGSVQTNKVSDLLATPGLTLVHGIDRRRLADVLQARLAADAPGTTLPCLLEVNASGDASKHGVAVAEAEDLLQHVDRDCPALAVRGLMAMGPRVGDPRPTFAAVAALAERLRQHCGMPLPTLSLGMSGDFEAAIAAGSTMVRVGTAIFGER